MASDFKIILEVITPLIKALDPKFKPSKFGKDIKCRLGVYDQDLNIKTIQLHYFYPSLDKIMNKTFLAVVVGIHFCD